MISLNSKARVPYSTQLNIGFLLIFLYLAQGALYAYGSIFSQAGVVGLVLFGLFCAFQLLRRRNPDFISLWIFFWLVQIITYFVSDKELMGSKYEAIGYVNTLDYIKLTSFVFSSLLIGYYCSKKTTIDDKLLIIWGVVYLVIAVVQFLYAINIRLTKGWDAPFTNSIAYQILMVLPYVPIILKKNKYIGLLVAVTILYFVMWGAKRGAILTMLASIVVWAVYYIIKNRRKANTYFLIVLALVVLALLVYYFYFNNTYLMERLSHNNGRVEGRSIAYTMLFDAWWHCDNIFHFIFGRGIWQSVNIWGNYAHNDWLELLTSNGVVGVFLYFVLFVMMFLATKKVQIDGYKKIAAYLCISVFLLRTFFSMGLANQFTAVDMILLGVLLGSNYKKKKKPQKLQYEEDSAVD